MKCVPMLMAMAASSAAAQSAANAVAPRVWEGYT